MQQHQFEQRNEGNCEEEKRKKGENMDNGKYPWCVLESNVKRNVI